MSAIARSTRSPCDSLSVSSCDGEVEEARDHGEEGGREERWAEEEGRTRQLNVWDVDLRPSEDRTFYWYLDVGQACCAAILDVGSDPNGDSYYSWPTPTCVGRGLVMAARGLRGPHHGIAAVVNGLHTAMAA